MKTTTKTDNRTLGKLSRDIATMRRRVGAAIRKHQKLQERIAKLQADGRIIELHKDAEIVAGEGCWYVKAESLNVNPDAETNYYYVVIFIEEYSVYQCSCEDIRHGDCKHSKALGAYLHENVTVQVGNTRIVAARSAIDNAVSHHQWGIDVVAAVEGGKSEARYFEHLRALDEQYSKAPSAWELSETQASEMRHFYDAY